MLHLLESPSLKRHRLNNPFSSQTTPEVVEAQQVVMDMLRRLAAESSDIAEELQRGKMMGVMVVEAADGEFGFLAGFSGCMAGQLELDSFVPPIFGRGEVNESFAECDRAIGELSREIERVSSSTECAKAEVAHVALLLRADDELRQLDREYAEAKERRDAERSAGVRSVEDINRESQHQKGERRRRQQQLSQEVEASKANLEQLKGRVAALKEQRRAMSNDLQRRMFDSYYLVNGRGESRSLLAIFEDAVGRMPPSGTGECAAPKMLHYALTHNLTPISIGEFWYGGSPRGEVRHHGHFYAACKSRCEPILTYMLDGVDVEPLVRDCEVSLRDQLRVVFEDEWLVLFDKPSGMLSVPGRSAAESVASIVRELYPNATGAMMVHRLDQDTSGLLLVAKCAEVHKVLQRQFAERSLSKRYIAVVEGVVQSDAGDITLPLMPNIEDRPRQMVSEQFGKSAHTTYEVLERKEGRTRLALTPHTGRTHQLRVHCAHIDGLSSPIVGDRLYGRSAERLLLHAAEIEFCHPVTRQRVRFESKVPF